MTARKAHGGPELEALESRLGHAFADRALLDQALTHVSAAAARANYQRLEFLGDRVVGLAVADMVSTTFPDSSEGDLARKFNRLVRGGAGAIVASRIGLGAQLVLSESEAGHGGRTKETILADAMEAVLGALFVEAGFVVAQTAIKKLWGPLLDDLPHMAVDPKSALQEWAQGRGLPLPEYKEKARKGPDHAPKFVSQVKVAGFEPADGEGNSKRAAEQAAATAFLKHQKVWTSHHHE